MDVTKYMVGKVSYVGKDYVNVTWKAGYNAKDFSGYAKLDKDSCNSSIADLKKNDYVIITNSKVNTKLDAVKTETVEGKISSTRDSGNDVRIDGNWYTSALSDNDKADIALSNTVTVVLKGNYIVFVDDVKTGSTDVALMIEAAKNSGVGAKWQADLLFPDGTRKTVDVKEDKSDIIPSDGKNVTTPMLVTYEQSGSKYELDKVDANNRADYDNVTPIAKDSFVKDGKVKGSDNKVTYINESATIFLKYGNDTDDYKVVTGADMKKWSDTNTFKGNTLTDDSKGYPYIKVTSST